MPHSDPYPAAPALSRCAAVAAPDVKGMHACCPGPVFACPPFRVVTRCSTCCLTFPHPPSCPSTAPPSWQILSNLVTNMTWQLVGKATVGSDIVSGWATLVSLAAGVCECECPPHQQQCPAAQPAAQHLALPSGALALHLGPHLPRPPLPALPLPPTASHAHAVTQPPSASPLPPALQLTESLYSVSWAFGSVVKAELDADTNKLAVTFFGDKTVPIREGRTLTLGPKAVVSYTVDKERNRLVNIAVKGQIDIDIRQAYLKPLKKWGKGTYADALEV